MEILAVIGAVIGIAAGLGGVIAFIRKGQAENLIQLQASENTALQGKVLRLENDNAALLAENKTLKDTNRHLKGLAHQTPAINSLKQTVDRIAKHLKVKVGE